MPDNEFRPEIIRKASPSGHAVYVPMWPDGKDSPWYDNCHIDPETRTVHPNPLPIEEQDENIVEYVRSQYMKLYGLKIEGPIPVIHRLV